MCLQFLGGGIIRGSCHRPIAGNAADGAVARDIPAMVWRGKLKLTHR